MNYIYYCCPSHPLPECLLCPLACTQRFARVFCFTEFSVSFLVDTIVLSISMRKLRFSEAK